MPVLVAPLPKIVDLAGKLLAGPRLVAKSYCCRDSRAKDNIRDGVLVAE